MINVHGPFPSTAHFPPRSISLQVHRNGEGVLTSGILLPSGAGLPMGAILHGLRRKDAMSGLLKHGVGATSRCDGAAMNDRSPEGDQEGH